MPGEFIPRCTTDGTFEAKQCHGSIGYCWCVDMITGKEVSGTRASVRRGDNVECKPPCEKLCPASYDPVCASDGKTYINRCELDNVVCKDSSVQLKSEGVCALSFAASPRAQREQPGKWSFGCFLFFYYFNQGYG